jgi:replicative DNA helicase
MDTTPERLPPHSVEAEEAVLGSLLIDPDALFEVADFLTAEAFYRAPNRWVYEAMLRLAARQTPLDVVTLIEELRRAERLEEIGGESTVISLLNAVPTSINVEAYGRMVQDAFVRRQMLGVAGRIAKLAWDETRPVETVQTDAENALFAVTAGLAADGVVSGASVISRVYDTAVARRAQGVTFVGLPTGLVDLDRHLKGLKDDDLIIVAGRPGMGKSSLANAIIHHLVKAGKCIASFNLEMSVEQQMARLLSAEARIPYEQIQTGQMNDDEFSRFNHAAGLLAERTQRTLWLDDTPDLTAAQLAARAKRLHAEHGLDLVVVDYLQLMADPSRSPNKNEAVGQNCQRLKVLARELGAPVICLAQLSRAVDSRADKRPVLSDLRDSGQIEQAADIVLFLYRDEYYNKDNSDKRGIVEVNCEKYRNGATFGIDLFFQGRYTTLANLHAQEIQL